MARCVHAARDGTSLSPAGMARAPGSGAGSGPGRCGHAGDLGGWHGGPLSTAAGLSPSPAETRSSVLCPRRCLQGRRVRPAAPGCGDTPHAPHTPGAPHRAGGAPGMEPGKIQPREEQGHATHRGG